MWVLGLTGGIGSGKSSASRAFAELGFRVIDADQLARDVIEPGTPGNTHLRQALGEHLFDERGRLDRGKVRDLAFKHPDLLKKLESVIHPLVESAMAEAITLHKEGGTEGLVLEVPLLLEAGMQNLVDRVVVVDLPTELQAQRAMLRDGATEAGIHRIIDAQMERTTRLRQADFVLDNSNAPKTLRQQVEYLVNHLKAHQ